MPENWTSSTPALPSPRPEVPPIEAVANTPASSMPVIPPTPWTPNTSSESSYLKRCFSQVQAQKHMEPAITPMTMPCHVATKPLTGVIVPRPAPAPRDHDKHLRLTPDRPFHRGQGQRAEGASSLAAR